LYKNVFNREKTSILNSFLTTAVGHKKFHVYFTLDLCKNNGLLAMEIIHG